MSNEQKSGHAEPVTIEINIKGLDDVATAAKAAAPEINKLADAFERMQRSLAEAREA